MSASLPHFGMRRFEGQVAVITGGASGIGLATAQRMTAEGATVVIWDRKGADAAAASLPNALWFEVDVTSEQSVADAAALTLQKLDRIDVLVTCAGIAGPIVPVQDHPFDEWRRVFDIHVNGTFLCCRAVIAQMIGHGYGRIVTLASMAGKEGNPNASCYSAAKGAIIAFTKSLGKELAHTEVRANVITPGLIDTPLLDQIPKSQSGVTLSKIPQGRRADVQECAAMIAFMASPEVSFNSGAVFDLSGGRATY